MEIIGLTLSDDSLAQVKHATTARNMSEMIYDIFENHTLPNKRVARRRLYTETMCDEEKVLNFATRIRQLAETYRTWKFILAIKRWKWHC